MSLHATVFSGKKSILILLCLSLSTFSVGAQNLTPTPQPRQEESSRPRVVRDSDGRIQVIITLTAPPLANADEAGDQTLTQILESIIQILQSNRQRSTVLAALTGDEINATVVSQTRLLVNTITVRVEEDRLDAIRNLEGVKSLHKDLPMTLDTRPPRGENAIER